MYCAEVRGGVAMGFSSKKCANVMVASRIDPTNLTCTAPLPSAYQKNKVVRPVFVSNQLATKQRKFQFYPILGEFGIMAHTCTPNGLIHRVSSRHMTTGPAHECLIAGFHMSPPLSKTQVALVCSGQKHRFIGADICRATSQR